MGKRKRKLTDAIWCCKSTWVEGFEWAKKLGTSEVCNLNEWRLTWVPRREVPTPKQRDLRPPGAEMTGLFFGGMSMVLRLGWKSLRKGKVLEERGMQLIFVSRR
jgi:hypothetical protein